MNTQQIRLVCDIYKGNKKEGMYLYVDKKEGLSRIPDVLLTSLGQPSLVTTLMITPSKKLARANAMQVLDDIGRQGFYLQMPPTLYPLDPALAENSKLPWSQ
ncbi:YcgL domain-containing protein [Porticoccaceae bacterium]|jgi:uncharacterized protein YcgL (UPF0745 family)|nr:YcgL domain-containing protein [Porticoccaceae bacterium]|tara:strand:- start:176 stop:481 length:306 start_codon:yes stop_codon:yes gene_type:complete